MNIQFFKVMKHFFLIILSFSFQCIFSQKDYKGKEIKAMASFQFKKSSYYDYQINAKHSDSVYSKKMNINTPEGLLTQKHSDFLQKNSSEEQKEIILYSRITIEYNLSLYYFIKYGLKNKSNITPKIAIFKRKEDDWIWIDNVDNKISKSILTILKLKNSAFAQFEIEEKDTDYPEINRLKPQVKDADGTLNLFKLSEVIEKNISTLSKYIE